MIEKYLVKKITEPVDWKVTVPGSKSMTNRALLIAALSAGTVRVEGVLFSDDSRHFSGASCGARLYSGDRGRKKVRDRDGLRRQDSQRGGGNRRTGSAGTAARFLAAMLGFSDGCYEIRC